MYYLHWLRGWLLCIICIISIGWDNGYCVSCSVRTWLTCTYTIPQGTEIQYLWHGKSIFESKSPSCSYFLLFECPQLRLEASESECVRIQPHKPNKNYTMSAMVCERLHTYNTPNRTMHYTIFTKSILKCVCHVLWVGWHYPYVESLQPF